jgi:hypothetical protein
MTEYDLQIYHVPGQKLVGLDALSRRPDHFDGVIDDPDQTLLPDDLFVSLIDTELASALKSPDPASDPVILAAQQALSGHSAAPMQSALSDWKIVDDTLYYQNRAYVPPHLHKRILYLTHDHLTAGHPGRFTTLVNVKRDYWWPGMGTFVRNYIDGCATCQQMKSQTHPSAPPMTLIPSATLCPFAQLSVDLITDLPESQGYDSVMVVVDHGLMKGVILTPCNKTITAEGVAKLFFSKVFSRFGLHEKLISDRGPQFASKFAKELGKLLDYEVALSTAYHPQTDGQTE